MFVLRRFKRCRACSEGMGKCVKCEALKHCDRCREDFPCSEDAWIFPEVAKMKYRKQQTTRHVEAEMAWLAAAQEVGFIR